MFQVWDTGTGREYTVYAVSGTLFLIHLGGELPRWEWRDMNRFEPMEETT